MTNETKSYPPWIRVRIGHPEALQATKERLRSHGLHTVCEEASCPNIGHCWAKGHATLLILGDRCTRGCRFCNVGRLPPLPPDPSEPERVAAAVGGAGLKGVVITSVTRDDLPDGGGGLWAETIRAVRRGGAAEANAPRALGGGGIHIEVLVPDFKGAPQAIDRVIRERPDVFGHNLETVPRLYPHLRGGAHLDVPTVVADYARSLRVLRRASDAGLVTKTSLMLGLGETMGEVEDVMRDARGAGCSIFFAGQYLQPSPRHAPVARYVEPEEFNALRDKAYALGFTHVASAPLVRSSYIG
ncbi:MAG: lipoyl synthase [Kiritimatiellaeota bacterium]|nr:lipoyl synthase [Kiritimatiellota bacterium]